MMKQTLLTVSRQKGLTIVEFTIVAVFFMFMIFAIIEGSRYVYSNGALSHVAREGARYAAVRGSQATIDTARASDAPATSTSVANYVASRSPLNGVTTSVVWTPNNTPGSQVTVTVSYTFNSFITLFNSVTLTSTATSIIYF
ncbi:pilus assembly protein [Vibrio sp. RE86]|uniref:TadE/TadG family type IV pilus assembly protein n=1 Tax=Vibrio sp. RE86 TaxID=2607605 RepID=UPI0014936D06|nr:TadE/TadG family type IV pilus assembly protein [Vibrio sp. RE86]NOH79638.1 pilus assembly protein [Vibrio sp. RE86]